MMQEAARKDVERCFGVLQARFAIVKGPARFWKDSDLHAIMTTCIILHNMIVDDERDELLEDGFRGCHLPLADADASFDAFLHWYHMIHCSEQHYNLRNDIIEHLWARKGEEQ